MANIEVNESYLPIRYLRRRELADSGGPGAFRGGVGTVQFLVPHNVRAPIGVLSFGQGLQHPAAIGIAGGEPGGQSGFAILDNESARQLSDTDGTVRQDTQSDTGTTVPMPTAGMLLHNDETMLVVSQGGGGFGDPIERLPESVVEDIAEGLVSRGSGEQIYGVVVVDGNGYPRPDLDATESRREAIRARRLGGRTPRPAIDVAHRRFNEAFGIVDGQLHRPAELVCRRCGGFVCFTTENIYEHLVIEETPTGQRAPLGLIYEGSVEFVVRSCFCPGCGRQVDVQIGRAGESVLRAIEPL